MLALTLHEPFAWAIAHAGKRVENRDFEPRGRFAERLLQNPKELLAIHAGKKYDGAAATDLRLLLGGSPRVPPPEELHLGAVVALATVDDIVEDSLAGTPQAAWRTSTRYGWLLGEVWVLPTRVACRGRQGLFELPWDVEEEVYEQWGKVEA